jgi:peroxiredoxin
VPDTGDKAPLFELPTQRGVRTTLSDVLERSAALVAFPGRVTHAAAHRRLLALARVYSRIRASNTALLVIVPNGIEQTKRYVEENGTPFHILCDTNRADVASRFGVRRRFTLRADTNPALFAVDRAGVIRYRLLGTWDEHAQAFADALDQLAQSTHPTTTKPNG